MDSGAAESRAGKWRTQMRESKLPAMSVVARRPDEIMLPAPAAVKNKALQPLGCSCPPCRRSKAIQPYRVGAGRTRFLRSLNPKKNLQSALIQRA